MIEPRFYAGRIAMALGVVEIIALALVFLSAIVAIKILLDLSPRRHQRRYSRIVKYNFLIGAILGFSLPWNGEIGLIAAATASLLMLSASFLFNIFGGSARNLRFITIYWPKEKAREFFLYFSITTGVIGIITTLLSLIAPILFGLALSALVPLAFDALSVLSALLEFTITVPPYTTLYALTYRFLSKLDKVAVDIDDTDVEDVDFEAIIGDTIHRQYDMRDAMENLSRYGFAIKHPQTHLKTTQFRINQPGRNFLQACCHETNLRINSEKAELDSTLDYLEGRLEKPVELDEKTLSIASKKIDEIRNKIRMIQEEYGPLLTKVWIETINERADDIEERLRLMLETK